MPHEFIYRIKAFKFSFADISFVVECKCVVYSMVEAFSYVMRVVVVFTRYYDGSESGARSVRRGWCFPRRADQIYLSIS